MKIDYTYGGTIGSSYLSQNASVSRFKGPTVGVKQSSTPDGKIAPMPFYASSGAAGADVTSFETETIVINPGENRLISTGLSFDIPEGYEIQVRPRSGLAAKHNVTVKNSPGTVDSDYTGIVKVILSNDGTEPFTVNFGDRIAQIVVKPVQQANFVEVNKLPDTERGSNGFGSTGV